MSRSLVRAGGRRSLLLGLAGGALLILPPISAGAAAAPPALDRSLRIVVSKENAEARLSADDLERVFLGKKTLWSNGTRIQPAMPDEESPTGEAFLTSGLGKSVSQFRAYWKRILFSGGGAAPKTFRTSTQVIEFVARQPGGVGVVSAEAATDDRVRILDIATP
jgi:ABC-type phosphate transport system substrate-binding protein